MASHERCSSSDLHFVIHNNHASFSEHTCPCRLSEALKPARGDISLAPRLHKTSVDVLAARHNSHSQSFNLGQQYKKVRVKHLFSHSTVYTFVRVCKMSFSNICCCF